MSTTGVWAKRKDRERRAFAAQAEQIKERSRDRARFLADARAATRAAEQMYRTRTRVLDEHEIQLGRQVIAGGRTGTIHAIARSLATDTMLVTVAHDPRIRITYPADEIFSST